MKITGVSSYTDIQLKRDTNVKITSAVKRLIFNQVVSVHFSQQCNIVFLHRLKLLYTIILTNCKFSRKTLCVTLHCGTAVDLKDVYRLLCGSPFYLYMKLLSCYIKLDIRMRFDEGCRAGINWAVCKYLYGWRHDVRCSFHFVCLHN